MGNGNDMAGEEHQPCNHHENWIRVREMMEGKKETFFFAVSSLHIALEARKNGYIIYHVDESRLASDEID